jgi:hypothetical protein
VTEETLHHHFARYGNVTDVFVKYSCFNKVRDIWFCLQLTAILCKLHKLTITAVSLLTTGNRTTERVRFRAL